MAEILPIAHKLESKRAAESRRRQQFREDLAALGFDPSMADWTFTWEVDANGRMIDGSTGIITPENEDG